MNGFYVKPDHVMEALENAESGSIEEGNVGGGTGMLCYEFKGGTGTSSRKLPEKFGGWTVGALVQSNFGSTLSTHDCGRACGSTFEGCIRYGRTAKIRSNRIMVR